MDEKQMEQIVLSSKIVLTMTVEEINKILSIISKYPFDEVNQLIRRFHEEGQPQINAVIAKLQKEQTAEAAAAESVASPIDVKSIN